MHLVSTDVTAGLLTHGPEKGEVRSVTAGRNFDSAPRATVGVRGLLSSVHRRLIVKRLIGLVMDARVSPWVIQQTVTEPERGG